MAECLRTVTRRTPLGDGESEWQEMDMDFEAFKALIAEIMTQGYDRETAGRYAGLIGHTPMSDARGNIVLEY